MRVFIIAICGFLGATLAVLADERPNGQNDQLDRYKASLGAIKEALPGDKLERLGYSRTAPPPPECIIPAPRAKTPALSTKSIKN